MNPSRQFKRVCQVVVGQSGKGILIENLRIQFEIVKTSDPDPNYAIIKIFNLAPSNEEKIRKEFDDIIVNAGYKDSVRLIFRGNIRFAYRYRQGSDWITEIEAGDGDKDFRNAVINETLAAGTTNKQLVDRAAKTFSSTTKGELQLKERQRYRGKVISGNTRDILHDVAQESGANWSIQDGQLQIIKVDSVLSEEAIVINASTGMLNSPEVNDKGIAVKALLNPQLRVNGRIKLDNNSIKLKALKPKTLANARQREEATRKEPVRLDPDGIYKILKITHKGDTRSNDWYTEVECIGLGQNPPAARTSAP